MADVLNRTTLQYLRSVNTPDYPLAQWIHGPDMSSVVGFGPQYWVVSGDVVALMTVQQRAAVDAAALQVRRDEAAAALTAAEGVLRAFMLVVLDEFNAHAAKINTMLTAVDNATSLADLKTRYAAIADYPARTDQQLRDAVRGKLGS